jgi:hypothetical protein
MEGKCGLDNTQNIASYTTGRIQHIVKPVQLMVSYTIIFALVGVS